MKSKGSSRQVFAFTKYMTFLKCMVVASGLVMLVSAAAEEVASVAGLGTIKIELNKLEEQGNACRMYMLFENPGAAAFTELKLDLMLFDSNGVVAKRLAIDGAPLRASKTTVKLFEVDGLKCADIGRVLLNDVTACGVADAPRDGCIDVIETASLSPVTFNK